MWPWERTLRRDELVRLDVPGVGTFEAVVTRAVPGAAELALVLGPVPGRYLAGRRCRATPAEGGPESLVSGKLVAAPDGDGGLRDDAIHLVLTATAAQAQAPPLATPPVSPQTAAPPPPPPAAAPPGVTGAAAYAAIRPEPPETQRRAFHRVAMVRPVTLVPERFRVGWLDGQTRDLSSGGVLVTGAERLREGDRVRLVLELGPGAMLDGSGRIVRIDEDGLAGVRWDHLTSADRDRLARYVATRQRAALAELRASA